jgi:hypothetical protein
MFTILLDVAGAFKIMKFRHCLSITLKVRVDASNLFIAMSTFGIFLADGMEFTNIKQMLH